MNIHYDSTGQITSIYFDEIRSAVAELPPFILVIDETVENKDVIFSLVQDVLEHRGEFSVVNNQLLYNGNPITLGVDPDLSQIRSEYQAALDRLQQIETSGTIPFTQAGFNQTVQAVKDIAHYTRLLAKILAKTIKLLL